MQFNLPGAILKLEDGVSFFWWHFWISMQASTPHRQNIDNRARSAPQFLTGSAHQAVSAAVTEVVSCFTQASRLVP